MKKKVFRERYYVVDKCANEIDIKAIKLEEIKDHRKERTRRKGNAKSSK